MTVRKIIHSIMIIIAFTLTAACSGGGSNNGTPSSTSNSPMGGAIQGKSLSLSNQVTTIAGSKAIDGTGAGAWFNAPTGVASDGRYLYVVDRWDSTIRKVDISNGTVTTFAGAVGKTGSDDGIGSAATFSFPNGIATDGTNLYVTDTSNCTIRKIVIATGEVSTLAGQVGNYGSVDGTGSAARFEDPSGIATDGTNLFVADANNTIRKVVIATGEVTTLGTFRYLGGLTTDGTNLYVGDSGTIRKINIATGALTTMPISIQPISLATDGSSLYCTKSDFTIEKIDINTGTITTLAGTANVTGATDGTGSAARFSYSQGITLVGGNLYVSDTWNQIIRKVEISSGAVTTVAGSTNPDGTGSGARFTTLGEITTDGANLYVTDYLNRTVRKIVIATGVVTTLAGSPLKVGGDGVGSAAGFTSPMGITTDGTNLYVAESSAIRKIVIATGEVSTLAGSAGVYSTQVDGVGSTARFQFARSITTDGTSLFVTDFGAVRKIDIATGTVTTLAGTAGTFGVDDGTGTAATFSVAMSGITTDGKALYVADAQSIRRIEISTGTVTTIGTTSGNSAFYVTQGITCDGKNLYITDWNNTIYKVVISTGAVTTIAGASPAGSADGVAAAASFNTPYGITTDGKSLYVADSGNGLIRKIQ